MKNQQLANSILNHGDKVDASIRFPVLFFVREVRLAEVV